MIVHLLASTLFTLSSSPPLVMYFLRIQETPMRRKNGYVVFKENIYTQIIWKIEWW
jgi:hypothetical protein